MLRVEKTLTFASCECKRKSADDDVFCRFSFSVVDSASVGTPRERETYHSIKITLGKRLRDNWGIDTDRGSSISSDIRKVAFQIVLEEITERLRNGDLPEGELPPLSRRSTNSEDSLPFRLSEIAYPGHIQFKVIVDVPDD